jgi:hypothetical protein
LPDPEKNESQTTGLELAWDGIEKTPEPGSLKIAYISPSNFM